MGKRVHVHTNVFPFNGSKKKNEKNEKKKKKKPLLTDSTLLTDQHSNGFQNRLNG